MITRTTTALAATLLACHLSGSSAYAHAVAGARVFPATLGIDDPGVGDELALPTFTYMPVNPDGAHEFDLSFDYSKTITSNFALSVGQGWTKLSPGGTGFGELSTEGKYLLYVNAPHEFMLSAGVETDWANTGSRAFSDPFDTVTPAVDFGKGFGDLPHSLDPLRPFALTGQVGVSIPTEGRTITTSFDPAGAPTTDVQLNPTVLDWGLTLQYSLPYYNSNIAAINAPDFFKRLIPIVEATFQTPLSNVPQGGAETTGTVQPGVIYMADKWQFALEALIPINEASGRSVGVIGELHFFFDDIFPTTLGKPIFGDAR
jgi:hypothetical protein